MSSRRQEYGRRTSPTEQTLRQASVLARQQLPMLVSPLRQYPPPHAVPPALSVGAIEAGPGPESGAVHPLHDAAGPGSRTPRGQTSKTKEEKAERRRMQNCESAERSRRKKRRATEALHKRVRDHEERLARLETLVDLLLGGASRIDVSHQQSPGVVEPVPEKPKLMAMAGVEFLSTPQVALPTRHATPSPWPKKFPPSPPPPPPPPNSSPLIPIWVASAEERKSLYEL